MTCAAPDHLGRNRNQQQCEANLQHRSGYAKCQQRPGESAADSTSTQSQSMGQLVSPARDSRVAPSSAVGIITNSEVPDARSWEKPKKKIRIGISKMPPPTPSMAEKDTHCEAGYQIADYDEGG